MGKFKEKLSGFMYGRYGIDSLYTFNFILIFILLFANIIMQFALPDSTAKFIVYIFIYALTMALLIWNIFRTYSKNIAKRRRENERFLKARAAVKRFFTLNTSSKSKSGNPDSAAYIFRDCTKCGSTLRLPRKEGKNKVKCPRCSHSFYVKAKKFKN